MRLLGKYNMQKKENLDKVYEELKQKVLAQMQQLSRYRKRQNQYYQHKMFNTDCKKFYSLLRQKNTNVKNALTREEIETFWKEIPGGKKKVQHNEEAYWITNQYQQNPCMECSLISET
jgi:hypothetical protein